MGNLAEIGIAIQVGHDHRLQQRGHFADDLGVLRQAIDRFAVVPVAIDANQHLGLDLAEAIKHALHAEIRRSGGPDGAERSCGQHGDQRFRQIGQVAATRSPSPTPAAIRNCWKRATRVIKLGAAHPPLDLVLAPENQRFAIIASLQQVFGVIQPRFGKPAGAGHFVAIAQHCIAFFADRAAEIPNFRPEIGGLID
jgi:hypothetical protein